MAKIVHEELSSSATAKKPRIKPSKPTKSSLSTEFVQDSDDSDEKTILKPQKKTIKARTTGSKSASTLSELARSSKNSTNVSEIRKSSRPSSTRSSPSHRETVGHSDSQSSAEDTSGSNSDSRNSSPTPVKHASNPSQHGNSKSPKTTNDIKCPKKPEPIARKSAKNRTDGTSNGESTNDSSSGSTGNGSESGTESESESSETASPGNSKKRSPDRERVSTQSQRPYEPPLAFEPANISIHPSSKVSEIFAPSNIRGKQLWHITAPVSVPIELIKEVSTLGLQNRASVLSHNGTEYGLAPGPSTEQAINHALLLPSTQNHNYRSSKIPISKTFHLQQLVSLPSHQHEPDPSVSRPRSHVKVPRQQPQGLKMRYHPFGAPQNSDSDASEPAAAQVAEFRMPESVAAGPPEKKKKRPLTESGANTAASTLKKKKHKSRHENSE